MPGIPKMNLYRINLNLLVAFDVLIRECHVSKAGEKLHITQSAMSKLLNQLRELFDDPILIRTPNGMEPTERAMMMHEQVRKVLQETEKIFLTVNQFDPTEFSKTIRIGMPDSISAFILPTLINKIKKITPKIRLHITSIDSENVGKHLFEDDIQLAITYPFGVPEGCKTKKLLTDKPVCIARPQHPLMKYKKIPLKQYLKYEHIVLIYDETPTLSGDRLLQQLGYSKRTIAFTVTNALTVLPIIAKSDLLFSIGELFAKQFVKPFNLDYRLLPSPAPNIPIHMYWSPVYDKSPWHIWLRKLIDTLYK